MLKQYKLRNYHFLLILYISALTVLGIMVIGSAEESVQSKQMMGFVLGLALMVIVSLMDYSFILRFTWVYYVIAIALLIWVQLAGNTVGGSQRWIAITDSFQFQPSEVVKIILILFFASFFMKHQEDLNTFKILALSAILFGIPLLLILIQPDLSTSIVTTMMFLIIIFVAGISRKIVLTAIAILVPTGIAGISYILTQASRAASIDDINYQLIRIYAWLYPDNDLWSSYATQQQNSIMAIGSGQLLGKGLGNEDAVSLLNGNYLSESQTDFIFAVIGEELGFVGSVIVIVLLLLIVLECIIIGSRAKDMAGRLICCGMGGLVGMQGFVNIGVATGLLPNTGIPLPFVSYGLTSLVSLFIGMGFVLNVGLQPLKYKGEII